MPRDVGSQTTQTTSSTFAPIFSGPLIEAEFLSRPNRFVAVCEVERHTERVFMPNPGRLGEILIPGTRLILADHGSDTNRKTRFTVMAAYYGESIVFLHTHLNNQVAGHLIENHSVPGLSEHQIKSREVKHGRSRFDFLLTDGSRDMMLEVKSCTLAANNVAMFPDAVTDRGRRHLEELARMNQRGSPAGILFVIHHDAVTHFLPDYHSDLAFSRSFVTSGTKLPILATSIKWEKDLSYSVSVPEVTIPMNTAIEETADRGFALTVLESGAGYEITLFSYSEELSRTVRKLPAKVFPIRTSDNEPAGKLAPFIACYGTPETLIENGATRSWVFRTRDDPTTTRPFHEALLSARMPNHLTKGT